MFSLLKCGFSVIQFHNKGVKLGCYSFLLNYRYTKIYKISKIYEIIFLTTAFVVNSNSKKQSNKLQCAAVHQTMTNTFTNYQLKRFVNVNEMHSKITF